jgi:putative oxidoreductase
MDIGLLILRLTVGLTLVAHGIQKLFGWFGGPGIDAVGQLFASLGFQPGRRHAQIASLAETEAASSSRSGYLPRWQRPCFAV